MGIFKPRSLELTSVNNEGQISNSKEKSGLYKGRHFSEYCSEAESLCEARRYDEAEKLLLVLCDINEAEAQHGGYRVAPAYYFILSNAYEDQGLYQKSIDNLQRYIRQPSNDERDHERAKKQIEVLTVRVSDTGVKTLRLNHETGKYHTPECRYATDRCEHVSRTLVGVMGSKPCGACNPQ